jgi:surface polysaccharide O-acyltransferase-like enzyme
MEMGMGSIAILMLIINYSSIISTCKELFIVLLLEFPMALYDTVYCSCVDLFFMLMLESMRKKLITT